MNGLISSLITFVGLIGITGTPIDSNSLVTPTEPCATEDVLWLARVTFSETKVYEEMPYIAWVVRNRVETGYMGNSYKEVALSPNQFSGLNIGDEQYHNNISLTEGSSSNASWQYAVATAKQVCEAPASEQLFPESVRHFYSPRSVIATPAWATNESLYYTIESSTGHADRFAFHNNVK